MRRETSSEEFCRGVTLFRSVRTRLADVFLMIRPPSRSTRTATLFPCTTLFRSVRPNASVGVEQAVLRLAEGFRLAERRHIEIGQRSEEPTSELQSLMRISYAFFCLKKNKGRYHMHCRSIDHTSQLHSQLRSTILFIRTRHKNIPNYTPYYT